MGHVHDLWPGQIEDFHNAHSECMEDGIVYMYIEPILAEYLFKYATAVYKIIFKLSYK